MCCRPNDRSLAAAAAGRACSMLAAAYTEVGALTCNALGGRGTYQLTCYTFGGQTILVTCPWQSFSSIYHVVYGMA